MSPRSCICSGRAQATRIVLVPSLLQGHATAYYSGPRRSSSPRLWHLRTVSGDEAGSRSWCRASERRWPIGSCPEPVRLVGGSGGRNLRGNERARQHVGGAHRKADQQRARRGAWAQTASSLPVGVTGEVLVGGVALARGYHQRADLTAERFVPDAWSGARGARVYRTGDRARWLPDGTLEYQGRADHQVKVRGMRVELGEVQAVLLEHAAVGDGVVDTRTGRRTARRSSWRTSRPKTPIFRLRRPERVCAGISRRSFQSTWCRARSSCWKNSRGRLAEKWIAKRWLLPT